MFILEYISRLLVAWVSSSPLTSKLGLSKSWHGITGTSERNKPCLTWFSNQHATRKSTETLQFANCCKLLWMVRISTSQIFVSKICRRSLEVAASLNCLKQVHGTIFEGTTLDTSVTSNRLILPVWIWMFTHLKLQPNAEKQHKSKFASSRHSVVQDNSW